MIYSNRTAWSWGNGVKPEQENKDIWYLEGGD